MPTYQAEVRETVTEVKVYQVEADSEGEARDLADQGETDGEVGRFLEEVHTREVVQVKPQAD